MSQIVPWTSPREALTRDPGAASRGAALRAPRRYTFRVGSFGFLIPEGVLAEAIDQGVGSDEMAHIPGAPPWVLGLANVRGRAIPVFDLRALLPEAPEASRESADPRFLMLGSGDRQAIFLVDGLPEPAGELSPAPDASGIPNILRSSAIGSWLEGSAMRIEFDHSAFLRSLLSSSGVS